VTVQFGRHVRENDHNTRGFRLTQRRRGDIRSSEMIRNVGWQFTDVSVKPIGLTFKDPAIMPEQWRAVNILVTNEAWLWAKGAYFHRTS
jgi:hypothetical protein